MEPKQTEPDPSTLFELFTGSDASYIPLIVVTITLALLVYYLVAYFANTKVHSWYVKVTTLVGWFFPFWIVFLLPLDLASTMYDHCEGECKIPFAHVSTNFLFIAWRTVYWTAFGLTWVIIPLMQSYVDSGQFTFGTRLTGAIRQNLKFYLIYAALGVVGAVYIIIAKPFESNDALMGFVMAMANSWGLLLAILFMGYGLVSVPRQLWYIGDTTRQLNALYIRAPKSKEDFVDAEAQVVEMAKELSYVSRRSSPTDPLRHLVDKMLEAFPLALDPQMSSRTSNIPQPLTVAYLASLNQRLKRAVKMRDRNFALWKNLLREAFQLQDIVANAENTDRRFHSTVRELGENGMLRDLKLSFEWRWYIHLRPVLARCLAVILGILSVAVLWSELTFNVRSPVLSLVAIGLRAGGLNYAYAEIISFVTVCYMCVCAYSSLLRLKVFNFYVLVPNHQTDELSLLWFAAYLCRLMAPLCHNYLNLASDQKNTNMTVFYTFMGKADLVPFLGSFVDWFPVVILIPATLQLLNIQNRLLRLCGMGAYEIDDNEAPATGEDTEGLGRGRIALNTDVEEGKLLVDDERHTEERRLNPDQQHQRDSTVLGRTRAAFDAYTAKYSRGRQGPRTGESGSSRQSALDVENSYAAADPNTARLRAELLNSRNGNRERGSKPTSSASSRSSSANRVGLSREDRDRRIDELIAGKKGRTIGAPSVGGGGTGGSGGGGYRTEDEDDGDESNESSFFRLTSKAKKGFGDLFKTNNSSDSGASSTQGFSGAGASSGNSRERLLGRGRAAQRQDPRESSQPLGRSVLTDMNNADADMDPIQSIVVPDEQRGAGSGRARSISPNPFSSFARASGTSSFGGATGGGGFGSGNGGGGARVSPFTRFEGPK